MSLTIKNRHSLCLMLCLAWFVYPSVLIADLIEPKNYLAGMHESEWQYKGSKIFCELSHVIPDFGIARFERKAGKQVSFRLVTYTSVPESTEAILREISPPWKHKSADGKTFDVKIDQGKTPVTLPRSTSSWLLSSLDKGQIGSFEYLDWDDTRKVVKAQLSPVNFHRAHSEFRRCENDLLTQGFESYRSTTVGFEFDIHDLSRQSRMILSELAGFIRADQSVAGILIEGHADDRGSYGYNHRLSAKRAKSVADYLNIQGINKTLIKTKAYGERRPKVKGRTEAARSVNRSAIVRLIR